MRILGLDNRSFDLNELPDEVDDNMQYSILDNSNINDPDFYFMPLIFLESFNSPAVVLRFEETEVQMPLDWCILVGDRECGMDPEVVPITAINERGFDAFVLNPITGFRPEYKKIEIVNIYNDVKWFFPKTKNNYLLSIPLHDNYNPLCAFFIKETSRQSEILNLSKLF